MTHVTPVLNIKPRYNLRTEFEKCPVDPLISDIYNVTKECCTFELYILITASTKKCKINSSTTVFTIDNNNKKCFFSTKSAYNNDY